jgi:hypothetical protein
MFSRHSAMAFAQMLRSPLIEPDSSTTQHDWPASGVLLADHRVDRQLGRDVLGVEQIFGIGVTEQRQFGVNDPRRRSSPSVMSTISSWPPTIRLARSKRMC